METNTGRSKQYLEKRGWVCGITEQNIRIPPRNGEPARMFKRDFWGMFDLIVAHPEHGIAGIQTTSRSNQADRIQKIRVNPHSDLWLKHAKIFVHGWKKTGPRGSKRKAWEVSITEIGPDTDFTSNVGQELPLFQQKAEEF